MTLPLRFLGAAAIGAVMLAGAAVQASAATGQDGRQGEYFDVNGARIFYQVTGSGTPMLLIHGFPLSGELFEYQSYKLGQRYKVITPDLPGFGNSTTSSGQNSDSAYADDMLALLDHLGATRAIIGGHSMGGQVTLELYRKAPRRFLGMVLFDTNPKAASIVEQHEWPGFGAQAQAMGAASFAPGVAALMITGATIVRNHADYDTLVDIVAQGSPDGVVGGAQALVGRPDFSAMLGSIAVPTLVMVGLDDGVYPFPISQALKQAIPGSAYALIRGAAHASMFEKPEQANAAIESWARESGL